ncbi:MAG: hypothetical protein QM493_00575 [Sulfurovum sp.]
MTYKINILDNANNDLNHKDRLVYTIYEFKKEIDISSCVGHYE